MSESDAPSENDQGGSGDITVNLKPGTHERRRSSLDASAQQIIKRRSQLSQDMSQALASLQGAAGVGVGGGGAEVAIDPYMEATSEVQELSQDKTKIEEAFQKIDVDNNEDIEVGEFIHGLTEVLKVELNPMEIEELFGFMDTDESKFISSTEWTMFLTQKYDSKLLEHYKDAILVKILSNPHKRKHSNLVQNADEWDDYEISKEQREMKEAMGKMLDPLVQELKVEDTLLTELHRHEQEDEDFLNEDKVEKWTKWEVASWLSDLKFDNYVVNFLKAEIDGSTLLFDMTHNFMNHLGVLRLHQGKLERLINDLKKHRSSLFGFQECQQESVEFVWNSFQLGPKPSEVVQTLQAELEQQRERFHNLQQQFMEIKAKLDVAQEQGFGLSDDDGGSDVSEDLIQHDSQSDADSPVPPLEAADDLSRAGSSQSIQSYHHDRSDTTVINPEDGDGDGDDDDDDEEDATNRLNRAGTVVVRQESDENVSNSNIEPMQSINETLQQTESDLHLASPASGSGSVGGDDEDVTNVPKSTTSLQEAGRRDSQNREDLKHSKRSISSSSSPKKRGHHKKKTSFSGKKKPPAGTPAFWKWLETEQGMQPNFANIKRVLKWTPYEVAWWMKINKYENYAVNFLSEKVNGEMLVRDLTTEVMKEELGVKMLHCGNILRRIRELREKSGFDAAEQQKAQKKARRGGGYMATLGEEQCESVDLRPTSEYLGILTKLVEFDELKQSRNQFENELLEKQDTITELETDIENLSKQVQELKESQEQMEKEKVELLTKQEQEDRQKEQEKVENEQYNPDFRSIPKAVRNIMEDIKTKAENDSEFCAASNANNWSAKEVAYWLELINFPDYIPGFLKQRIDGEILISDIDKQILTTELGVLSSHAAKILRQRDKLKSSVPSLYTIDVIPGPEMKPDRNLSAEFQQLENELEKAKEELEELRSKPQVPEDHMIIKNDEYNLLTTTIEDKKKEIESIEQQMEELKQESEAEKVKMSATIENLESKIHEIEEAAIPEQEKQEKQQKEQEYLAQLKAMADTDESFGSESRIKEWSIDEVCWWLHSFAMDQYFQKFKDQNITGAILVNDIGQNELESYFNIKTMHRQQVMRELDELKIKCFGRLDIEDDILPFTFEPEHRGYVLLDKVAELEAKIQELNDNYENSMQDAGAKAGNITELNDQINDLKAQIEKLEFEMSQEEWIKRKAQLEDDVEKLTEELEVKQEVKDLKDDLAQRARDNPTFANPKLAIDWTVDEVLHWIYTLEIGNDYIQTFRQAAINGSSLLSDLNPTVLTKDLNVAPYHVGKMIRDIERLRKLSNVPLTFVTNVTDILFEDQFLASQKIEELEGVVQDEHNMREALALEADKLRHDIERLQDEISNLEEGAQLLSEQLENATKGGPTDDNTDIEIKNNNNNNGQQSQNLSDLPPDMAQQQQQQQRQQGQGQDDQKSISQDNAALIKSHNDEIKKLKDEILRMTDEKIALVRATAEEMDSLRKIVLVLSREYEAISGTPLGKVAPYATVDGFLGVLGLERAKK